MDNEREKEGATMSNEIKNKDSIVASSENKNEQKDLKVLENNVQAGKNEELHEATVKLMSPTRMVMRRFFRSKLSVIGLIMIVALFIFCFVGPEVYNNWESTDTDSTGKIEFEKSPIKEDDDSKKEQDREILFYQVLEVPKTNNTLAIKR